MIHYLNLKNYIGGVYFSELWASFDLTDDKFGGFKNQTLPTNRFWRAFLLAVNSAPQRSQPPVTHTN